MIDELFEILDCYVEEYTPTIDWSKIWYSTSDKMDRKYDGNTTTITGIDSLQLTTSH